MTMRIGCFLSNRHYGSYPVRNFKAKVTKKMVCDRLEEIDIQFATNKVKVGNLTLSVSDARKLALAIMSATEDGKAYKWTSKRKELI